MATVFKRGKYWHLQWSDGQGQHRESLKKYGVTTEAEAKNYKYAKELELGTGSKIISKAPVFRDFINDYLEWYKYEYPSSYNRTKGILESLIMFHAQPINIIDPAAVEFWKAKSLKSGKSSGTVAKEFRAFKACLNRAVEWGKIDRHPFGKVKAPKDVMSKPPEFYTLDQIQALYKVATTYRYHWQFMVNTGVRRGEFLNLKEANILPDAVRLLSEAGARTKSGKWREVPLNKAAHSAARELIAQNNPRLCQAVTPYTLTRAFDRDRKKAGLNGNLHWLRHTFVSHLVMSGMNLRKVQILAGHANYSTTEKYAHLAPSMLKDLGGVEI